MTTFYYWIPIGWNIILFLFNGATYSLSIHYIFQKQTLKQYVEKKKTIFLMFECMLNEKSKKKIIVVSYNVYYALHLNNH